MKLDVTELYVNKVLAETESEEKKFTVFYIKICTVLKHSMIKLF